MRLSRHPRWSRILVLLALFHIVAPSVAAIADAWRVDGRVAYDHIESESTASCVVVHTHDCALCSVATGPSGAPARVAAFHNECTIDGIPRTDNESTVRVVLLLDATPRAPPVLKG